MQDSTYPHNQASPNGTHTSGSQNGISFELSLEAEPPARLETVPPLVKRQPDFSDEEQAERAMQAKELLRQADVYLMQGKVEPAIAHYRRALEFDSNLVDAHQGLAEALTHQGHLEEAAAHYQKAIDLLPSPLLLSPQLTTAEQSAGNSSGFGAALASAPASAPGSKFDFEPNSEPDTEILMAESPLASPNDPTPVPTIDQLPWYEQAAFYLQQGAAFCDRQQWQDTISACERAVKLLAPQMGLTFRLLGRAWQAKKQLDEAEQSYCRSLAIDPAVAETYARLGSVYAEQGQFSEAVDLFQQAIERDPNFAGAYLKLGEVWQQLGDREQAADCLYRAYRLQPGWKTAKEHLQLGNLLMVQGKYAQAEACYRQAIELMPQSPDAYHNLAVLLGKQQRWQEAIESHQQAIERQPKNPRLYAALGQTLMRLNRWQEAIDCYQKVTQLMPEYPQLQNALAQIEQCQRSMMAESYGRMAKKLADDQQWQEAMDCYRQAIDRNSQNVELKVGLAQAFSALMQWQDAAVCYEEAIALQASQGGDRSEELQAKHYLALADVLVKLGRFEEATQHYRQVILNPSLNSSKISAQTNSVIPEGISEKTAKIIPSATIDGKAQGKPGEGIGERNGKQSGTIVNLAYATP
ncbi:tetratricopeptide repeat protein [Leptolyngbya ohadii]|uniref:tetratricopeptide repeat protein n=1 Tax=Leptolyngbya ohadii TaxID=1962290 RepID=UPI000B59E11E|nr:tetratricopeptide repeat protein [Leptolyngbya ohadii]